MCYTDTISEGIYAKVRVAICYRTRQERQVSFVSVMAAIGVLGGLTIIAVIVVVAAVTVTVAGAFNSIKDEDAVE